MATPAQEERQIFQLNRQQYKHQLHKSSSGEAEQNGVRMK